jgi:hypothetical protein
MRCADVLMLLLRSSFPQKCLNFTAPGCTADSQVVGSTRLQEQHRTETSLLNGHQAERQSDA